MPISDHFLPQDTQLNLHNFSGLIKHKILTREQVIALTKDQVDSLVYIVSVINNARIKDAILDGSLSGC